MPNSLTPASQRYMLFWKNGDAISSLPGEAGAGRVMVLGAQPAASLKHAGLPQQKGPVTDKSERREKSDPRKLGE